MKQKIQLHTLVFLALVISLPINHVKASDHTEILDTESIEIDDQSIDPTIAAIQRGNYYNKEARSETNPQHHKISEGFFTSPSSPPTEAPPTFKPASANVIRPVEHAPLHSQSKEMPTEQSSSRSGQGI